MKNASDGDAESLEAFAAKPGLSAQTINLTDGAVERSGMAN